MSTTHTAPADLTNLTPAEVDTHYGPLFWNLQTAKADAALKGLTVERYRKRAEDAARLSGKPAEETYDWAHVVTAEAAESAALAVVAEIMAEVHRLDAEFARRGGWARGWLCITSSGAGHYHSSHYCQTLNRGVCASELALTPALSGANEADLVGAVGTDACSYCFPTAKRLNTEATGKTVAKAVRLARRAREAAASIARAERRCARLLDLADAIEAAPLADADQLARTAGEWNLRNGVADEKSRKAAVRSLRKDAVTTITGKSTVTGEHRHVEAAEAAGIDWRGMIDGLTPAIG